MDDNRREQAAAKVAEIQGRLEDLYLALIDDAHTLATSGSRNVVPLEARRREIEALEYALSKAPKGSPPVGMFAKQRRHD